MTGERAVSVATRGDRRLRIGAAAVAAGAALLLAACGQDQAPAPSGSTPGSGVVREPATGGPSAEGAHPVVTTAPARPGDSEKGRQVYLGQCASCHNADPSKNGPVGPAVKGSAPELLEARVLRAAYPSGYKPKRNSKAMPARPDLASSLPDLAAYLR